MRFGLRIHVWLHQINVFIEIKTSHMAYFYYKRNECLYDSNVNVNIVILANNH